jgi:hypothetical protein
MPNFLRLALPASIDLQTVISGFAQTYKAKGVVFSDADMRGAEVACADIQTILELVAEDALVEALVCEYLRSVVSDLAPE